MPLVQGPSCVQPQHVRTAPVGEVSAEQQASNVNAQIMKLILSVEWLFLRHTLNDAEVTTRSMAFDFVVFILKPCCAMVKNEL